MNRRMLVPASKINKKIPFAKCQILTFNCLHLIFDVFQSYQNTFCFDMAKFCRTTILCQNLTFAKK